MPHRRFSGIAWQRATQNRRWPMKPPIATSWTSPRTYFTPDSEVMEFGCGTGTTAVAHGALHAQDPGLRHLGKHARDCASACGRGRGRQCHVRAGRHYRPRLPSASFDVVMGHSILHLLAPKKRARRCWPRCIACSSQAASLSSSTVCLGEMAGAYESAGGRHSIAAPDAAGSKPFARWPSSRDNQRWPQHRTRLETRRPARAVRRCA